MITIGYSTVYLLRVLKENDFYAYNGSTEGAFCSESGSKTFYVTKTLLSRRYPQQRGNLLIQKAVEMTMILMRRAVVERTISIWRAVVERAVSIWRV